VTAAAADRRAANALVVAAAAAVSFQQAGRATRDALFLSTFGVAALPRMFIVAAVVSAALTISLSASSSVPALGGWCDAFGVSGSCCSVNGAPPWLDLPPSSSLPATPPWAPAVSGFGPW
jgi:hypothetical protein